MIHQAIGRGALRFAGENAERRQETVGELQTVVSGLLPLAAKEAIDSFAAKVVDLAINLKKAMVEEQALYQVFWVDCNEQFQEHRVEVVDDEPSGRVLLCTFPGLERMIRNEKEDSQITVVKASGFLKSSFQKS